MPLNPTSGATLRGDINTIVEEAAASDTFFIGHQAMPPVPVDVKAGQYPKLQIAAAELMSLGSVVRERSGAYAEVSRQWTTDSYDCLDRGLEEPVDDTDVKDLARFFALEASTAKWLLRNVKLDHENRVATAIMNATNFGAGTNSTVAYTNANIATINFLVDLQAAVERVNDNGAMANTIVMSSQVFNRIAASTLFQAWVRGSAQGQVQTPVNAGTMARALADFGIEKVLIGRARYNSAKKGQAKSMSLIWGNTYVWVGETVDNPTSLQDGGAGHTLVWNAEGGLFVSESYRDEKRRSNIIRVRQNTAEKVIDGTAGTLITTQYS